MPIVLGNHPFPLPALCSKSKALKKDNLVQQIVMAAFVLMAEPDEDDDEPDEWDVTPHVVPLSPL